MVYIKLNRESRPKMHSIFVFFFHLLTVEQKGNENNQEENNAAG